MIQYIRKRDGRMDRFDVNKIAGAIYKAFQATDAKYDLDTAIQVANEVEQKLEARHTELPTVELVQDTVEETLIEKGYVRIAKAYILYRAERSRYRKRKSRLMQTLEEITFQDAKDSDLKRENANVNADAPMGTMLKYGVEAAKQFNEMFVLNPIHSAAHISGDIHIHDKDFYALTETCCQIDLIKLFKDGFSTGHGFLREPNDIRSYTALACIAIQANQNEMHGGQSVPNFDYAMALGVAKTFRKCYFKSLAQALQFQKGLNKAEATQLAKTIQNEIGTDITMGTTAAFETALKEYFSNKPNLAVTEQEAEKMHSYAVETAMDDTDDATYQAMEALIHNLNTMNSRAGAQVPFSSLNYGTDTSPEGRMAMKNILLATEKGLPPYTILQQKALLGIVNTLPSNSRELLAIPGIGKKVIENYGSVLLELVEEYKKQ